MHKSSPDECIAKTNLLIRCIYHIQTVTYRLVHTWLHTENYHKKFISHNYSGCISIEVYLAIMTIMLHGIIDHTLPIINFGWDYWIWPSLPDLTITDIIMYISLSMSIQPLNLDTYYASVRMRARYTVVCLCVCVCVCVCVDRYSCSRMNQVQVRVSIGF